MKKAIVLLLALAVLGGAVFAQDAPKVEFAATVTGGIVAYNDGTNDTVLMSKNLADLDFSVGNDVIGLSAELEFQSEDVAPSAVFDGNVPFVYANYAYGWYKFFDGMVQADFGYLYNTDYRLRNTGLSVLAGNAINANGFQLHVKPVEGLALSAFLGTDAGWLMSGSGNANYTGTVKLADAVKEMDLFAKYALADIGTFYASYEMVGTASTYALDTASNRLTVGASITAVPNVAIKVGFVDVMYSDKSNMSAFVTGSTSFDAISVAEDVSTYLAIDAAKAFGWKSLTRIGYKLSDAAKVGVDATVYNKRLLASDYILMAFKPSATLTYGDSSLGVAFEYQVNVVAKDKNSYAIPVTYTVTF